MAIIEDTTPNGAEAAFNLASTVVQLPPLID